MDATRLKFGRLLAGALVALTLTAAHATAEPAAATTTARYRLHNGTSDTGPARLVIRHCGTVEDSWAHLRFVDYSGDTTVLRCARAGY